MKILRKIWARKHLFSTIFVCLLTVLVVFFSVSTFLVPHAETAEATENFWETMADMPTGRLGPGVAAVNGKIYVIGGMYVDFLNTNKEYDPVTDTWATKTSMPTPRGGFGIAVYQNKIYVIGGSGVTGANEVYDPSTDTWTTKTSMPTAREFLCANVVNGKIYLIGGSKPFNPNDPSFVPNVNEVYDPSTDSWTTKTPPPTQVSSYASAVVDNKIYVIGGWNGSRIHINQIYNPETDTWSFGSQIPNAGAGAAAGATTGVMAPKRIYVLGGNPTFTLNQVYDPETDTWTMGAQMPTSRYGLGIAVVNDILYAIGCSGSPDNKKNDRYTPFGFGTVPPTISIVSPENKMYAVNNVSLTFTVNELTSWIGYSLDEQVNVTITGDIILTGLSDGSHSLTVYAKDIAGNTGASQTIIFRVTEPFPTTWIVAAIVLIAAVGAALLVYFVRVKKTTGKLEE